jgi:hypothetical protein
VVWKSGKFGFDFRQEQRFFFSSQHPYQLWSPPSLLYNRYWEVLTEGVKLTILVLRLRVHGAVPPFFMVWHLIKHRNNFA